MANRLFGTRYSEKEIRWMVEEYEELQGRRGTQPTRLLSLLRHADLSKALSTLSRPEREAVVLHGMLGVTTRTSGVLLGVSAQTISNRYRRGLERLTKYLNGGS